MRKTAMHPMESLLAPYKEKLLIPSVEKMPSRFNWVTEDILDYLLFFMNDFRDGIFNNDEEDFSISVKAIEKNLKAFSKEKNLSPEIPPIRVLYYRGIFTESKSAEGVLMSYAITSLGQTLFEYLLLCENHKNTHQTKQNQEVNV